MRRTAQLLIILMAALFLAPIFLPENIHSQSIKEIEMPAGVLFEEFNNLNDYSKWEPWTFDDEQSVKEFYSPYRGQGAGYKWESDNDNGQLTIIRLEDPKSIEYEFEMEDLGKPALMKVEFTGDSPQKTTVNWNIASEKTNYFTRYFNFFKSKKLSDKMEEGLENLETKLNTTAISSLQAKSLEPGMVGKELFEGRQLAAVSSSISLKNQTVSNESKKSFNQIFKYLTGPADLTPEELGNRVIYYTSLDTASETAEFYSGIPINEKVDLPAGMEIKHIPEGEALICTHKGSYETLDQTIDKIHDYAKKRGLAASDIYWVEFLNDPDETEDPKDYLTKVYIPLELP